MALSVFLPVDLFRETCLFSHVQGLVADFTHVWNKCASQDFCMSTKYSPKEQRTREQYLKEFIRKLESEQKKTNIGFENIEIQDRIFSHVRTFFQTALGFRQRELDLILSPGFKKSTKDFVELARRFDPTLKPADVFQACRNVWIMNGLQLMLGLPVKFTPSIFAYSMLYPHTDNYLDDASISKEAKAAFNNRFAQRLAGIDVKARNAHERTIYSLVAMIEDDFERVRYPKVFASLLAIHQAQTKSVLLLGSENLTQEQVLKISLEKGGTSVLADGYLVAGDLNEDQARFMFGYGAYLQFLDDLQDVREDGETGQRSIYTLEAKRSALDAIANKTFYFGDCVLASQKGFAGKQVRSYTTLMRSSIQLMLLEATGFAPDLFTTSYMKKIEKHSPFRFSCLRTLRKQHAPYYASMFGKLL